MKRVLEGALFLGIVLAMLLVAGCDGQQANGGILATSVPDVGYSSANPAPVGAAVTFHELVNDSGQGPADYTVRLTLVEVLRGDKATDRMVHDIPYMMVQNPPDREFLVAHFRYELVDASPSGVSRLVDRDPYKIFIGGVIDPDNNKLILGPKPDFYGKAHKGEAVDGWIAYTIPKDSKDPRIVYNQGYAGNDGGGIWFKAA